MNKINGSRGNSAMTKVQWYQQNVEARMIKVVTCFQRKVNFDAKVERYSERIWCQAMRTLGEILGFKFRAW